ncbi:uncharacterized protein YALI1_D09712g [Yarrowia lipolytica]|uniref:Uncharacterized protein n=1 Tax=Yarrowia lipolytica TaxID=4952 RepID=A0A1D8NDM9_YARLL|nr:hypothetical protein YALI1_D09712g [Yarrowia lipolytica]
MFPFLFRPHPCLRRRCCRCPEERYRWCRCHHRWRRRRWPQRYLRCRRWRQLHLRQLFRQALQPQRERCLLLHCQRWHCRCRRCWCRCSHPLSGLYQTWTTLRISIINHLLLLEKHHALICNV